MPKGRRSRTWPFLVVKWLFGCWDKSAHNRGTVMDECHINITDMTI